MGIRRAPEHLVPAIRARWEKGMDYEAPRGIAWWTVDGNPDRGYAGARMDERVCHLEAAYVPPAGRGHGLQRALIRARVRWARAQGAHEVRTYTHGGNVASIRSLVDCGFNAIGFREGQWLLWGLSLT